jgi:hypothetical protein
MVSKNSKKVTPRSSERIRNENKTRNAYPAGTSMVVTLVNKRNNKREKWEKWGENGLSLPKKSPRTEPDIPKSGLFKKGYQGVLSPIGKCIRSEIENRKCVVHAVVQGDKKARAIMIAMPTQLDHGRDLGRKKGNGSAAK